MTALHKCISTLLTVRLPPSTATEPDRGGVAEKASRDVPTGKTGPHIDALFHGGIAAPATGQTGASNRGSVPIRPVMIGATPSAAPGRRPYRAARPAAGG